MEVLSIVQSGIRATRSKLNVQWIKEDKGEANHRKKYLEYWGSRQDKRGRFRRGNSIEELGGYFRKISGGRNSPWIVTEGVFNMEDHLAMEAVGVTIRRHMWHAFWCKVLSSHTLC